jgi:Fe-S cluster assembly protein SufD
MSALSAHRSTAEATIARQFAAQEALAPSPLRAAAFARFAERGLPTRRIEAWHYTDLRAAMTDAAPLAPAPDQAAVDLARKALAGRERVGAARLVLLDGHYVPALSDRLPAAVEIAWEEASTMGVDDALVALNEAMTVGGCAIAVSDGVKVGEPVEILHVASETSGRSLYSRVSIALGAGAQASFVEVFLDGGPGAQRNAATSMTLAEDAKAKHIVMIGDSPALHVESLICELGAKAQLNAFALVSGGALTRRQIFVKMTGAEAKVGLGGLALIDGSRRADTTLQVVHCAPGGTSREFYRAIVDDDAIGVFQGKVIVEGPAQKTDGAMKSQTILLSPRAQMNAKPELEIFADDVVCGHGATIGSLDPEQIFYLRSRGIAEGEAQAMLLEAFGVEAIDLVDDERLAGVLRAMLRAWLSPQE